MRLRDIITVIAIIITFIRNSIYSPPEENRILDEWEPVFDDVPDDFLEYVDLPFTGKELKENQLTHALKKPGKEFGLAFFYNLQNSSHKTVLCHFNLKGADRGWVEQIQMYKGKDDPDLSLRWSSPLTDFTAKKDGHKKYFLFSKSQQESESPGIVEVKVKRKGRLALRASVEQESKITSPVASCRYINSIDSAGGKPRGLS